jgi:hypothetical protein
VISSPLFLQSTFSSLSPPANLNMSSSQAQEDYVCEEQTYPCSPSVLLPSSPQPVVAFANEGASQALLEGDDESNHPSPTATTDGEEEGEDDRPSPSAPPAEEEKEEEEAVEEEDMQGTEEGERRKRNIGTRLFF